MIHIYVDGKAQYAWFDLLLQIIPFILSCKVFPRHTLLYTHLKWCLDGKFRGFYLRLSGKSMEVIYLKQTFYDKQDIFPKIGKL